MSPAARETRGPTSDSSSSRKDTTPTLASRPGTPVTGEASPNTPGAPSSLATTHGGSNGLVPAVLAAKMARPAAAASSGLRLPTRYVTCISDRVGSATRAATDSPPSTRQRYAVHPTASDSIRSAGNAASRTTGCNWRPMARTPSPSRQRPSDPRRISACCSSVTTSRYTTVRPILIRPAISVMVKPSAESATSSRTRSPRSSVCDVSAAMRSANHACQQQARGGQMARPSSTLLCQLVMTNSDLRYGLHSEGRDDLEDADNDQPDASDPDHDAVGRHRVHEHDHAADEQDDTEEDVPAASVLV